MAALQNSVAEETTRRDDKHRKLKPEPLSASRVSQLPLETGSLRDLAEDSSCARAACMEDQ